MFNAHFTFPEHLFVNTVVGPGSVSVISAEGILGQSVCVFVYIYIYITFITPLTSARHLSLS